jgi:hypothetical protein
VQGPLAASYNIEGDDDLDPGGDNDSVGDDDALLLLMMFLTPDVEAEHLPPN